MNANTHARLMAIFSAIFLFVGLPLFILLSGILVCLGEYLPVFAFLAAFVAIYLTLELIPVRCTTRGCDGRMQRTRTQISTFKDELQYQCPVCNSLHTAHVLHLPQDSGGGLPQATNPIATQHL